MIHILSFIGLSISLFIILYTRAKFIGVLLLIASLLYLTADYKPIRQPELGYLDGGERVYTMPERGNR